MDRAEHLAFCKRRALEYLDHGNVPDAIASMGSDLSQHPETAKAGDALMHLGLFYAMNHDVTGARRWIEGFN